MITINLLPWRVLHRQKLRRQKKIAIVVGVVLGVLMGVIVHWQISLDFKQMRLANTYLSQALQAKQADADEVNHFRNQSEQLLKQLNHIQNFQRKKKLIAARFEEIFSFSSLPITFYKIHFSRRMLALRGQADSLEKMVLLVNQLNQSQYFEALQFKEIHRDLTAGKFNFEIHMGLKQ